MTLVVVDASAMLEYLLRTEDASSVGQVIEAGDTDLHVPALCDVEVAAGLRRAMLAGRLRERRAGEALDDQLDLPLVRHGHRALLGRVLALRHNFSAYDAVYVALAEALAASLLTADRSLARAARSHTAVTPLPEP